MCYFSAVDEGDVARLLGDDDHVCVRNLGDTDRGLVPHSESCRNVLPVGNRQGTARSYNAAAVYYHRSVVERGVLEEQVQYQSAVDRRVDPVPGLYYVLETVNVREDDKRPGFRVGHRTAGFCDFVEVRGLEVLPFLAEEFLDDHPRSRAELCLRAYPVEEMPDLRLEDHDKGQDADIDERPQQRAHEFHVEGVDDDHQHVDHDDCQEDIQRRRIADPAECNENNQGNQKDVQQVHRRHVQYVEYAQNHILYKCSQNNL